MYANLEAEMARRKITKKKLAERIDIPYQTLRSKFIGGKFSTDEAFKIIDALEMQASDIRYLFASESKTA